MSIKETIPALRFKHKPIRGLLTVELFDAKTNELVQKVEKENLVTNAIENMLQAYAATNQMGNIMPLATVGLGGLMLFDETLEADADNFLFPGDAHLVGYALQEVNTSNTMRGSKNSAESSIQLGENGKSRTVWDFGTSQANGTIKSVSLTRSANPFRPLSNSVVAQACHYQGSSRYSYGDNSVLAYEDGYVYVVHSLSSSYTRSGESGDYTYTRTYTMTIHKTYAPMRDYKVGDSPTNNLVTPNEVHQTVTWEQVTYNTNPELTNYRAVCVDFENDGSSYIIWSPGNTFGDGALYVTKITRDDLTWTASDTEILTFENAQFLNDYHKIVDGYFMVVSYDRHSIYKIDMSNLQDISKIDLPENYYFNDNYFWRTPAKNGILFFGVYIDRTEGTQTTRYYRNAILYPDGTTVLDGADDSGNNIMDHMSLPLDDGYGWGGNPGNRNTQYVYGRFFSNYLGTIANLSSPVVKNPSQTLKITYQLIDA